MVENRLQHRTRMQRTLPRFCLSELKTGSRVPASSLYRGHAVGSPVALPEEALAEVALDLVDRRHRLLVKHDADALRDLPSPDGNEPRPSKAPRPPEEQLALALGP